MKLVLMSMISLLSMNISPQFMMLMVIILSLVYVFILNMMMGSMWFGMVFYLVTLGGLMIVFLYLISLFPNDFTKGSLLNMMLVLMLIILVFFTMMGMSVEMKQSVDSVMKLYESNIVSLFMMIYLLVILFAAVKISVSGKGPIFLDEK